MSDSEGEGEKTKLEEAVAWPPDHRCKVQHAADILRPHMPPALRTEVLRRARNLRIDEQRAGPNQLFSTQLQQHAQTRSAVSDEEVMLLYRLTHAQGLLDEYGPQATLPQIAPPSAEQEPQPPRPLPATIVRASDFNESPGVHPDTLERLQAEEPKPTVDPETGEIVPGEAAAPAEEDDKKKKNKKPPVDPDAAVRQQTSGGKGSVGPGGVKKGCVVM